MFFFFLFRGFGRWKKNLDIFFELFNNLFKYFKVDYYFERFVSLILNGEFMRMDEINNLIFYEFLLISVVNVMFDGLCDVNNNVNGGECKDLYFKMLFFC